ncbi:MAG: SCP2 sterol-binding domain-containing protein [Candidatus Helarchaeota archaeon]|nr:SCP2 sterol-binding domain-containing protein [Candidatus Helarchaeota archaeon]
MDEIKGLVDRIYTNSNLKAEVASWIDKYDGKIIEFQIGENSISVILTKERWKLIEDSYPSPDVIFVSSKEVFTDIMNGSLKISKGLKGEKLQVYGNFHDLKAFLEITKKGK